MTKTPSSMVELKTQMPEFTLDDAEGNLFVPSAESEGTLVIFICNHCPFVVHVAAILEKIHQLCSSHGIQMIAINSNDITSYPDDSPEHMIETAATYSWTFPYLFDADQDVAKAFNATCTPDIFLYDKQGKLYYRGQFDDSRPSKGTADGADVIHAIENLANDEPSPTNQTPSIGCNIKWKM
jgi:peroxiredoxin